MSSRNKGATEMKKLAIACAMLVASVTASVACDGGCAVVLKASDGYWNLRATPSGRILLRLYRGDTVEMLETAGTWTKIALHNSDVVGWISSNGIQEIPCQ
jgi:SH3 domain-containing protein